MRYPVNRSFQKRWIGIAVLLCLASFGCGGRETGPSRPDAKIGTRLPPAGYAVQMGAFSRVSNAIRLTRSLEAKGLEPYYFRHKSGLFKVRVGDFRTRGAAEKRARELVGAGIIDRYYVVSPKNYAAVRARVTGTDSLRKEIVETAERFIGVPYQWGGASSKEGFDCSGLTMAVYQLNGLNLPRSSRAQFRTGDPIGQRELEMGDLVFFSTAKRRKVSHVGIYRGDGRFIHAPGEGKTIRTDSLSSRYYSGRYAGARTYLRE